MSSLSLIDNGIIRGRTINDVWRDALWCAVRKGYSYTVKEGSYVGQKRLQLESLVIEISEPWTKPLSVFVPETSAFSAPTSEDSIHEYFFKYLMTNEKSDNEDYTYGQYIYQQLPKVVEKLSNSDGRTNQATIVIGDPQSINLNDPPCLRLIDFKRVDDRLDMSVFFRSWDLFAGLPENLGGLQLLKEYVVSTCAFPVEDGKLFAYSSGAHIYEQYFPLVDTLNIDKIGVHSV